MTWRRTGERHRCRRLQGFAPHRCRPLWWCAQQLNSRTTGVPRSP